MGDRSKSYKQRQEESLIMGLTAKEQALAREQQKEEEIRRTPMPRQGQVLGICDQRLGGSHLRVCCLDGKTRLCRIPGRFKRRLWVREGDTVLVEPWELGGDEKGDILYKYSKAQVQWMKKKGFLKGVQEFEEF